MSQVIHKTLYYNYHYLLECDNREYHIQAEEL